MTTTSMRKNRYFTAARSRPDFDDVMRAYQPPTSQILRNTRPVTERPRIDLMIENRPHDRESTSFDNDCKFTYSFTAHMHEIPKYLK